MAANLTTYRRQVARLIQDRSNLVVPSDELDSYINLARDDVAKMTGCLRCLIAGNAPFGSGSSPGLMTPGGMSPGIADTTVTTFATLPGVEKYAFEYARPFLIAQNQGFDRVLDLIDVAVSWGSASRPVMEWRSWEELQALARIYSVGVFSYPYMAAKQGDGTNQVLYLFPVPNQALEMEWDVTCLPAPLFIDANYEALPSNFTDAVPLLAARYCYLNSQRYGSADMMENIALGKLGIDRASSARGEVPSYYC